MILDLGFGKLAVVCGDSFICGSDPYVPNVSGWPTLVQGFSEA